MNYCPNLNNKLIKQEFEELVSVLGEDTAYYIWDKSNGNGLELAPNGASSKLFKDLLELNNGDRAATIRAKAKLYTKSANVKDLNALDENGEVLAENVASEQSQLSLFIENDVYNENHAHPSMFGSTDQRLIDGSYQLDQLPTLLDIIKSDITFKSLLDVIDKNLYKDVKVKIERTIDLSEGFRTKYNGRRAFYDASTNTIYVDADASFEFGDASNVLFHELIHAITVNRIKSNPKFVDRVREIIADYQKAVKKSRKSGKPYDARYHQFTNDLKQDHSVEEFIANVWTDPDTVYILKRTKSSRGKSSLWERFKNLIKSIFKGCVKDSLYEEATDLIFNLLNQGYDQVSTEKFYDSTQPVTQELEESFQKKMSDVSKKLSAKLSILYKTYKRIPNKSPRREKIQNDIFECLTEIKRHQTVDGVNETLNFALKSIGVMDQATQLPQGYTQGDTRADTILAQLKVWQLNDYKAVTPELLMEIYKNSISFYQNMYDTVLKNLQTDTLLDSIPEGLIVRQKITELKRSLDVAQNMWKLALYTCGDSIVDKYIDEQFSYYTDKEREGMKYVFKDWLHKNSYYGDINYLEANLFNYEFSKNEIIKTAFHVIRGCQRKTREESLKIAGGLNYLYKKVNWFRRTLGGSWQTIMMEKDYKGRFTGNFIRDLNYGQCDQDLMHFREKLNKEFQEEYGHFYYKDSDTGEWMNSATDSPASEEEWGDSGITEKDEPVYIKYLLRIEKWKCDNKERRFTYTYYKERLSRPYLITEDDSPLKSIFAADSSTHGLSLHTLLEYDRILSNINYYLDKCTHDDGMCYPEELDRQDKQKLDAWQQEMDDLSNPFNIDGTVKRGDDLRIAMEIRSWNKWISERTFSDADFEQFRKEEERIRLNSIDLNNPQLLADFYRYNSSFGIHPRYIEQTIGMLEKSSEPLSEAVLVKLFQGGLRSLVNTQDSIDNDLLQMLLFPSFWMNCRLMDFENEYYRTPQSPEFASAYERSFVRTPILYKDEFGHYHDHSGNTYTEDDDISDKHMVTFFDFIKDYYIKWAKLEGTIPGLIITREVNGVRLEIKPDFSGFSDEQLDDFFTSFFTYRKMHTKNGETKVIEEKDVPLSIFFSTHPSTDMFLDKRTGEYASTEIRIPRRRFSVSQNKVASEELYNPYFDKSRGESEYPGYEYDNSEEFNKLQGSVKRLYDALIETMILMNKIYNPSMTRWNYKLPQINAENGALLSRLFSRGIAATGKSIKKSAFSIQENDQGMRSPDSYITNPDGSVQLDIPTKYLNDLPDSSEISTDVTGSVILFLNAAINYKNAKWVQPIIETLRANLDPNNRAQQDPENGVIINDNSNSIKVYDSMVRLFMYQDVYDLSHGKIVSNPYSSWGVFFNKSIKTLYRHSILRMMCVHAMSMSVGFADSWTRALVEGCLGKYFSLYDLSWATIKQFTYYNIKGLLNFGDPRPNNKITALMLLNGLSKSFELRYSEYNRTPLRKFVTKILMLGFTALDYISNMIVLQAHYGNMIFYKGDKDIPAGFYNEFMLKQQLKKAGKSHTSLRAKAIHTRCFTTLLDAYKFNSATGTVEVKEKYAPYVNEILKDNVNGTLFLRTALLNGTSIENDSSPFKGTLIGAAFSALRNFLFGQWQHLFAGGDSVSARLIQNSNEGFTTTATGTKKNKPRYKLKDRTDEQKSNRFAINHETGMPSDEILRASYRLFKKVLMEVGSFVHICSKSKIKITNVEKYAISNLLVTLLFTAALIWPYVPFQNYVNSQLTPPISYTERKSPIPSTQLDRFTRDKDLARQQSGNHYPWENGIDWSNGYNPFVNDYFKLKLYLLQLLDLWFRTIESKLTNYDILTAYNMFKTPTTLSSGWESPFVGAELVFGDKADLVITGMSSYKNYTNREAGLEKILAIPKNLHTTWSYYGLKNNIRFYYNTYGKIYKHLNWAYEPFGIKVNAEKDKTKKSKSLDPFSQYDSMNNSFDPFSQYDNLNNSFDPFL